MKVPGGEPGRSQNSGDLSVGQYCKHRSYQGNIAVWRQKRLTQFHATLASVARGLKLIWQIIANTQLARPRQRGRPSQLSLPSLCLVDLLASVRFDAQT